MDGFKTYKCVRIRIGVWELSLSLHDALVCLSTRDHFLKTCLLLITSIIWLKSREKRHSDMLKKPADSALFQRHYSASSRDINHLYSLKGWIEYPLKLHTVQTLTCRHVSDVAAGLGLHCMICPSAPFRVTWPISVNDIARQCVNVMFLRSSQITVQFPSWNTFIRTEIWN